MRTRHKLMALGLAVAVLPLGLASDVHADDSPLDGPIGELIELLGDDPPDPDETTRVMDLLFRESVPCVTGKTDLPTPSSATTPEEALGPFSIVADCMLDLGEEIVEGRVTTLLDPNTFNRSRKRALKKAVKNLSLLAEDMSAAAGSGGKDRAKSLRRAINRAIRPVTLNARGQGFAHVEDGLYAAVARATQLETAARLAGATDLQQRLDAAVTEPPPGRKFKQASKRLAKALRLLGECQVGIGVLLPIPDEIEKIEDDGGPTPADFKRQRKLAKQFNRDWPKLMNKLFLAVKTLGQAAGPLEQAILDAGPPAPTFPPGFFATVEPGTYYASFYPGNSINPPGQGLDALDEFTNWHFTHSGSIQVTSRELLWADIQTLVGNAEQDLPGTFDDLFFNVITHQGESDWEAQRNEFLDTVVGSDGTTWRFFASGLLGEGYAAYADYRAAGGDTTSIVLYLYRDAPPLPTAFVDLPTGEYLVEPLLRDFRLSRDVVVGGRTIQNADPESFWAEIDAELGAQVGNLESLFGAALDSDVPSERTVLDELIAVTGGCGPDHLPMDFSADLAPEYTFTRTITCSPLDPQGLGASFATLYVRVSRVGN